MQRNITQICILRKMEIIRQKRLRELAGIADKNTERDEVDPNVHK